MYYKWLERVWEYMKGASIYLLALILLLGVFGSLVMLAQWLEILIERLIG